MLKAAVLFPGIGYVCRYPLLYYTASAAVKSAALSEDDAAL